MSRRTPGRDAALAEIQREEQRQRRERDAQDRAAALEHEHDDEDRALDRARMRAVFRAPTERRERVANQFDGVEADLLRERAGTGSTRPPAIDFDAGRGATPAEPPTPTWRNPSGG